MSRSFGRREFLVTSAQGLAGLGLIGSLPGRVFADDSASAESQIAKGVAFLRGRQGADGSWSSNRKEPGITALVVSALLRSKQVTADEPVVTKGLAYLEGFVGPKGGLSEAPHANYTTAIALMVFHDANKNGKYDKLIASSQAFLKGVQWDESEGKDAKNDFYGGSGYGGNNSRPDLSNTAFFMEALRDSGLPADDPALRKALVFVSRCQNLKTEFNDQPWADKINDGGFVYTAANGGSSVAGKADNGGLRSYPAMTYAGLKSMIYAGLTADDPRVKAALEYIGKHYSVDDNPGLGERGLYYYYQTFAKSLAVLGKPTLVDAAGKSHDWRADLTAALGKRQAADGSWVNKADGFMEGDANLVTAYAIIALSYTKPKS